MEYLISLILICCSALFSGLTLGLLSLDVHTLKRRMELGDAQAAAIYPIRKQGNLLLTTLLLGNVAVNTALSVFLGSIVSGVVAGFAATALIFLFGEIIPQAAVSRHALYVGAKTAPLVRALIFLGRPVTYPIAAALDWALGQELPTLYSKQELMQIISEHEDSEHSPIDADEERIVHGALQFSHTKVREAMTPLADVVMYEASTTVAPALFESITDEGYSRYPIYEGTPERVVGILFAKDLLTEDEGIAIRDAVDAFDPDVLRAHPHTYLDSLLTRMLKEKKHLAVVEDASGRSVGLITLEDIIEEIIQVEIEDEDDAEDALEEAPRVLTDTRPATAR